MFLTGCTGFFGVWLLETFRRADERLGLGLDLTLLSRSPERFIGDHPHLAADHRLRYVRGDVRSFDFPAGSFSHVIHGATTNARETFAGEDPFRKFDTVAMGTRRVLEFCEQRSVPDMLYIGSGAVYGRRTTPEPIVETDLVAPDPLDVGMTLGHAKRVAELFCAMTAARSPIRIKIARCFSFVGPQLPLDIHYAIGNFIADALAGRPITIKGDGSPVRSYLYTSDLVAWLVTILIRGATLRPYNVGSEDGMKIRGAAAIVAEAGNCEVESPGSPYPTPVTAGADSYLPSTERARGELSLAETVPLHAAIVKTLTYHRC
jgi:nucleoside-diphosphate-sugar epimerase